MPVQRITAWPEYALWPELGLTGGECRLTAQRIVSSAAQGTALAPASRMALIMAEAPSGVAEAHPLTARLVVRNARLLACSSA